VPLGSLAHVLEWQLQAAPDEGSLELLLTAVHEAGEVPLPGHTPGRADGQGTPEGFRALFASTEAKEINGHAVHPHSLAHREPCSNCGGTPIHEKWCPVAPGQALDPLAR
jgi:hypothetical protein